MPGVFYGMSGGSATVYYSVAAIPEPSTWALMLIGFAGLIGLGRLLQPNCVGLRRLREHRDGSPSAGRF
jgi:hypothetical protein